MDSLLNQTKNRRAFLKFLASSPLCSAIPGFAHDVNEDGEIIRNPADALDVFDFKASARDKLPAAHYGYMTTGTFDDKTLHANREAFENYYLRSRRLVNVSSVDTSVSLFDETWPTPIVLSPASSQRAFHNDGELASARAARSRGHLQILSTVSSYSVEDVTAARGAPVWYQLYTAGGWEGTRSMLHRAEAAGSPVLVVTVDLPAGATMRNTLQRWTRTDQRNCDSCHAGNGIAAGPKPMLNGYQFDDMPLTWDFLRRLRDETTMKIVIKGIVTAEDAERCIAEEFDGIIVSNHGGRADNSGRGAIESLAEVASVARGRTTLLMDSGIRRGTDIVTALALGADAICIGRPYLWGLGSFGQAGVERVLELLHNELVAAMQFGGMSSLDAIGPDSIGATSG